MHREIIIRPARPDEREALVALQRRASLVNEAYRAALTEFPDAIDLPAEQITARQVHVCTSKGAILGFAVVLPVNAAEAELDGLFVEPLHWREGVGRRLVTAAMAIASAWGATAMRVVAADEAVPFYQACGFVISGREQTRFALAPVMTARLLAGSPVAGDLTER